MEQDLHPIFVENLPERKSEEEGKWSICVCALDVRGGAIRAIERLNRVRWKGKAMIVKEAKYKRLNGRLQEAAEETRRRREIWRTTVRKRSTRIRKGKRTTGQKEENGGNAIREAKRAAKSDYYS
ncbi:hypothetical protein PIB30_094804 [Stylosanthes scabra]|uniref:RRM domain-containing protein n=1 Tax=Stylosanthes scabra TaxID=79078 RepID=A0ABU6ZUC8_9FABA|nr:hypothetical protein [Stylosanthes scabra]